MIEKKDLFLSCFQETRTFHIYTPQGYGSSRKKYPVMYMYDGHNLFHDEDATFGKSWGLEAFLLYTQLDVIIVGMECNHQGNQRLEEYSPYDFYDQHVGEIHGRGKELMEWFVQELKPWVDGNYRTLKKRKYTGIIGSSMGGLMALYTILHHNDTFSMAGCISCFLTPVMDEIETEINKQPWLNDTRIYLSWGSDEFRTKNALAYGCERNLWITQQLLQREAAVFPYQQVKGRHDEASWEKQLNMLFTFLLR